MKALSIRQPWASLITDGPKRIENRTWKTSRRGWVLVHAAVSMGDGRDIERARGMVIADNNLLCDTETPLFSGLYPSAGFQKQWRRGGIIGAMRIDDCVDKHTSPWFTGPHGFVIGAVVKLPFLPVRGRQGFFEVSVSDEYLAQAHPLMTAADIGAKVAQG